jgi:branched-subunit amino acid aminotransferase/4-amino-4-deoxychorismate lyase
MFPDSNARRSHRIARILHHPTFFGWLKIQLEQRKLNRENELYEAMDEILTDRQSK